jgi:RNA polymerase sigma factor (sigma-70 family)
MVPNAIHRFLDRLRQSPLLREGGEETDAQLLEAFLGRQDAGALEALVRRHAPMVWGVCRRTLTHHDAEDAFQATFLVLVRRAASIRTRELLANWLYGVAHKTVCKARQRAAIRSTREPEMNTMPEPQAAESPECDFGPEHLRLLDEELSRLPEKYRAAIVLCDLEGRARPEAARQLDVPEGTVASRLARGRALLAQRLTRRGLGLSATTVAAVWSEQASGAVTEALLTRTINAVGRMAAGQTVTAGLLSTNAPPLTEAVLRALLAPKWKAAAVVLLLAGLALGGGMVIYHAPASQKHIPKQPPKGSPADPGLEKYGTAAGAMIFAKQYSYEHTHRGPQPGDPDPIPLSPSWPSRDVKARFDPQANHWTVTGAYRCDCREGFPLKVVDGRLLVSQFERNEECRLFQHDWKLALSYNPSARAYGVQKAEGLSELNPGGLLDGGWRPARTDDLGKWLQGRFMKPRPSAAPVTALRLVLDVPETKKPDLKPMYSYGNINMAVASSARDVTISIDDPVAGGQVERWTLRFGAPFKHSLKAGEYGGAYRFSDWFSCSGPLIDVSRWILDGGKRTSGWSCGPGEFVVREIELQDQKVVRLAIDFITDSMYGLPSTDKRDSRSILRGSLRFNSRFEPSVPRLDADAAE